MNSQRHHILRRPNLQDLRRLKFTRQLVQTKYYSLMNLHMYTNSHEGQMLRRCSAGDVNLRGIFFTFRAFFSIATATAAAPESPPSVTLASSSSSSEEDSEDAAPFPRLSSSST
jgi:hypothetical protein